MAKDTKIEVSGFVFYTEEDAAYARKESEGVEYTRSRIDMADPKKVLNAYNKIISSKMFKTPVGHKYLSELRDFLIESPDTENSLILPIDFNPKAVTVEDQERLDKEEKKKEKELKKEQKKLNKKKRKDRIEKAYLNNKKKKILKEASDDAAFNTLRTRFAISLMLNIVFLIVIILMVVMVKNSDIPTIIDYENKLIDRYEDWENNLNEREEKILEYEEKYNIENGFNTFN